MGRQDAGTAGSIANDGKRQITGLEGITPDAAFA